MAKIGVIGVWHLGEIYSAGFAALGYTVVGISDDEKVIADLNRNIPPLAEPGLGELIQKYREKGTLEYASAWEKIRGCDVVWITFDTPVNEKDEVDVLVILEAIKKAGLFFQDNVLLGVSSQIPVGTSKKICELVKSVRPGLQFEYAYSPENLRLGEAVKCFLEPGRIVIGADTVTAATRAAEVFAPLKAEIVSMNVASAEMAKHALNAFLATCISFTNDLADVSGKMGGDIEDVIKALKSDPRVGPKAYLFAGLGFSGATLARDLKALLHVAEGTHLSLPVIRGVLEKNQARNTLVQTRLEELWGSVQGKTLALLGVTYKAGTPTLRRSQALEVEQLLQTAGASFRLYDPLARREEVKNVTPAPFFQDPYEAVKGADGILIVTPSKEFKKLDFAKLKAGMRGEPVLFDAQNVLCDKEKEIKAAGFKYLSIGRP